MSYIILPGIFTGPLWQIIGETSVFGLFILLTLACMSFVCWVIIFHKWRQFKAAEHAGQSFLHSFRRSHHLADSLGQAKANTISPLSGIYLAGYEELTQLKQRKNEGGQLQEKQNPLDNQDFEIIEMTMERTATDEIGKLEKQIIFLATTGNSAPFMGLLGTVVGIMDAFWSIGERGSASLAVVAPGIAEALLATIVGLGAAIPAVIAFNWANNKTKFLNDHAASFVLEFLARAKKEAR